MTQIAYAVAFLFLDREAGRVRPSTLTGLGVLGLAVASHLWLNGPWLERAGFPAAHASPAAAAPWPVAAPCADGGNRR